MTTIDTSTTLKENVALNIRPRLAFVDGLRGLAAFIVLMAHCSTELQWRGHDRNLTPLLRLELRFFAGLGGIAVAIFIVLSGFCLMLPVVRHGTLQGGWTAYLKRRAFRILPPYYMALLCSLVLIAICRQMSASTSTFGGEAFPAFTPAVLLSHLAMVHNWSSNWSTRIDPPLWTVATEWQIYFIFPLILLPVWRRFGIVTAVLTGFVIGLTPLFLWGSLVRQAAPWFVGFFAMGMAAAVWGMGPNKQKLFLRFPLGLASAVLGISVIFLSLHSNDCFLLRTSMFACFFISAFICYCMRVVVLQQPSLLIRFLEHRRMVLLGEMSYSLYLIHDPIVGLVRTYLTAWALSASQEYVVLMVATPILCVGVAYIFHICVEKHFIRNKTSR